MDIIKKVIKVKKRVKRGLKYNWAPYHQPERNKRIFEMRKEGKTFRELSKIFGLSDTRIAQIVRRLKNIDNKV